jgi:hypothetical protein
MPKFIIGHDADPVPSSSSSHSLFPISSTLIILLFPWSVQLPLSQDFIPKVYVLRLSSVAQFINRLAEMVMLLTFIQELPGLNVDQDTLTNIFHGFLRPTREMLG